MELNYRMFFIGIISFLIFPSSLTAQGCVAIRHFSSSVGNALESNLLSKGDIQAGMNYRYFKSFRHFKGSEEEPDRVSNNTEVINYSHSWDFNLSYGLTNRLFATITLPFVLNERSSLYEHGREERNVTFSRGIGDIRLGAGYWLFNPETHVNGNLGLGLGLKLPTGKYNDTDIFYNVGPESSSEVRPVDQSIQPGDGGFGFTADFQFYQSLSQELFVYGGGFYLFNPKETNGIRTFRETLNVILENESIMSVTDQFAFRSGLGYNLSPHFSISLGARYEGIPVEDVLGKSGGFRRPGKVLSIDPGISYMKDRFLINLNVPVAILRNRPQSVTDLETEIATGEPRNGDAAFADYLINVGISYRFNGKPKIATIQPEMDIPLD